MLHTIRVVEFGSLHHTCEIGGVFYFHVALSLDQHSDNISVAILASEQTSGVAFAVEKVYICFRCYQQLRRFRKAVVTRLHQRGPFRV